MTLTAHKGKELKTPQNMLNKVRWWLYFLCSSS